MFLFAISDSEASGRKRVRRDQQCRRLCWSTCDLFSLRLPVHRLSFFQASNSRLTTTMVTAKQVLYCGSKWSKKLLPRRDRHWRDRVVCTMPPEVQRQWDVVAVCGFVLTRPTQFCEFSGTQNKCKEWLQKNHENVYNKLYGDVDGIYIPRHVYPGFYVDNNCIGIPFYSCDRKGRAGIRGREWSRSIEQNIRQGQVSTVGS